MKKKIFQMLFLCLAAAFLCFGAFAAGNIYDVNGDGKVGLIDVLTALRAAVNEPETAAADVNGDGRVDLADVLLVLRHIVNSPTSAQNYSYTDIVKRLTDTRYLSLGSAGEKSYLASSYDRTSAYVNGRYLNWRANGDGSGALGETTDGGILLADITGAGYISRIWSATVGPGHVKIFIDGETEATVDLAFSDYFSGKASPFVYSNLVYTDSAQGKNCYLPITFSESCRVVAYGGYGNDGWGKFYHINYTLFPSGVTVERMPKTFTAAQTEALRNANAKLAKLGAHPDGLSDAPFETAVITKDTPFVKTLSGKGALSGLLVRVDSLKDEYAVSKSAVEALKNLRIKIWWDDETDPAVNAPLGDFFASGYGFDAVKMLLLGMRDDRTFYNYFYMPYLTGARIEIYTVGEDSETVSLSLNVTENTCAPADMLYFGAQFSRGQYHTDALDADGNYDKNGERSPDYRFLTVNGSGRFVGLTLHHNKTVDGIDPLSSPGTPWWGEGDEKIFVDGEEFPSWFGTGTEDFFGFAWCSPLWFNKPYHAQSYCEGGSNGVGNRVVSRLLLGDSIPFTTGFDGYIEKYYTDAYTKYGFTSYFYLSKGSTVTGIRYTDDAPLDYYKPKSEGGLFIEGEDLYVEGYLPGGSACLAVAASHIDHQTMTDFGPAFSGNSQVIVYGLGENGSIDFTLTAPESGKYMLLASFTNAPDFSIVQTSVNGKPVGDPIDTYGAIVSADRLTEIGEVTLTAGDNTLRFTYVGKNAAARGTFYRFAIDFLLLVPSDSYSGTENIDLSEYTDVYRANTKHAGQTASVYRFEGETELYSFAKATSGTLSAQSMTLFGTSWSGDKQLFLSKPTQNTTLTLYIQVAEAGQYDLSGAFTEARDYGRYTLSINNAKVAAADFYHSGVILSKREFGRVTLKAGYNKLVFTCDGKNMASIGYCLGIDYLEFVRAD